LFYSQFGKHDDQPPEVVIISSGDLCEADQRIFGQNCGGKSRPFYEQRSEEKRWYSTPPGWIYPQMIVDVVRTYKSYSYFT
jgi:hypothetical protein